MRYVSKILLGVYVLFMSLDAQVGEHDSNYDELVKEAVQAIKNELSEVKSGKPHSVACKYSIDDGGFVPTSRKVYYTDYRKMPDFRLLSPKPKVSGQVVEVIYKTANNQRSLTLIRRSSAKKSRFILKKCIQVPDDLLL